jgi:DNA-binding NarL/FixJ family response regulator
VADGIRFRLADKAGVSVVHHVTSGHALLEQLATHPADLVLMDVTLPGMDGIDTMRALHKRLPEMPVLAHSALTEIEYVNSMLIEGARGYLVKGGPHDELAEAIDVVMNGGQYISPAARQSIDNGYAYCDKHRAGEYIGLSQREREIIRLIALERTNDEIATALFISSDTVKTHRKSLMTKLNVRSLAGLVKYANDRGWI